MVDVEILINQGYGIYAEGDVHTRCSYSKMLLFQMVSALCDMMNQTSLFHQSWPGPPYAQVGLSSMGRN